MISNPLKKSMNEGGAVDNRGGRCALRSLWRSGGCLRRGKYIGLPYVFVILLVLFVGAAAAPTQAEAAGCSGTGNCYWIGGTGSWSQTANWTTDNTGVAVPGDGTTGSLPTATDSVHFNAYSNTTAYTVTVDTTANMNDLMFDAALSENEIAALGAGGDSGYEGSISCGSELVTSVSIANRFFTSSTQNDPVDILKPAEGIEPSESDMTSTLPHQAAGCFHCNI